MERWSEDIFELGAAWPMLPNIKLGNEILNLHDPYIQYHSAVWLKGQCISIEAEQCCIILLPVKSLHHRNYE